jgi:hypothetical protein
VPLHFFNELRPALQGHPKKYPGKPASTQFNILYDYQDFLIVVIDTNNDNKESLTPTSLRSKHPVKKFPVIHVVHLIDQAGQRQVAVLSGRIRAPDMILPEPPE